MTDLNEPDCPHLINSRAHAHREQRPLKATSLLALLQPQVCSVPRLDPDSGCESESIKVFDGNSASGPLLGKACSTNDFVPVFESSSNSLTFQIVTDGASFQRSIFIFYYFFSSGTSKLSKTHPFPCLLQSQVTAAPAGDTVLSSLFSHSVLWWKGNSPVLPTEESRVQSPSLKSDSLVVGKLLRLFSGLTAQLQVEVLELLYLSSSWG